MSIDQQNTNDSNASAQSDRSHRLTASNLALHEQNTTTISTDHAIHSWLNDSGTLPPVHVDDETWIRLFGREAVDAAIKAAIENDGAQSGEQQK